MFADGAPTKLEKTENVEFYEYSDQLMAPKEGGEESGTAESFTHFVSDYKGQNLGTIVQTFIIQQETRILTNGIRSYYVCGICCRFV